MFGRQILEVWATTSCAVFNYKILNKVNHSQGLSFLQSKGFPYGHLHTGNVIMDEGAIYTMNYKIVIVADILVFDFRALPNHGLWKHLVKCGTTASAFLFATSWQAAWCSGFWPRAIWGKCLLFMIPCLFVCIQTRLNHFFKDGIRKWADVVWSNSAKSFCWKMSTASTFCKLTLSVR